LADGSAMGESEVLQNKSHGIPNKKLKRACF